MLAETGRASRPPREGFIDLLGSTKAADVTVLFKEVGRGQHARQRPHQRPRRRGGDHLRLRRRRPRAGRRLHGGRAAGRGARAGAGRVRAGAGRGSMLGVVNLDKPVGPTSHDMVDLLRRLTGMRRIGHAGTLDPLASGVLPILVGGATRFSEELTGGSEALRGGHPAGHHAPRPMMPKDRSSPVRRRSPMTRRSRAALATLRGHLRAAAAGLFGAQARRAHRAPGRARGRGAGARPAAGHGACARPALASPRGDGTVDVRRRHALRSGHLHPLHRARPGQALGLRRVPAGPAPHRGGRAAGGRRDDARAARGAARRRPAGRGDPAGGRPAAAAGAAPATPMRSASATARASRWPMRPMPAGPMDGTWCSTAPTSSSALAR